MPLVWREKPFISATSASTMAFTQESTPSHANDMHRYFMEPCECPAHHLKRRSELIYGGTLACFAARFKWKHDDPEIVSDVLFALANVISFARTTYLMPAFEVLGPLQISFNRMLGDITRFMVPVSIGERYPKLGIDFYLFSRILGSVRLHGGPSQSLLVLRQPARAATESTARRPTGHRAIRKQCATQFTACSGPCSE